MLTHGNVIATCAQVDASERLKGLLPADVVLLVLPLFHIYIYALNVGLTMALRAGASIVFVARFEECR
jgi:acyl-CoA synthetase (AMP-forming)/AMP-acid ligase II